MTPYYSDSHVQLYLGDAREVLPQLAAGSVQAVVTDPPYGIEYATEHGAIKGYASWAHTQIQGDTDTACRDFALEWAKGMPVACFGSWKVSRPAGVRAVLIWDKGPASGMGNLSLPWKLSWEEIYILGDGWRGQRDEGVLKGHTVVTWESRGRLHPNEKPLSLLRHLVGKLKPGIILDPFAGSGTTLRAAKDLGRRAIGIEIEERYCEVAARRLEQGVLPLHEPEPAPEQGRLFEE